MALNFENANIAVIEAAYDNIAVTQVATAAAVDTSQPSLVSDGVPLLNSSRAIIVVKPESGASCDVEVYAYFDDGPGWVRITELDKTSVSGSDLGDAWKANIGGASRLYIRLVNIAGGAVDAWILRSYV